LWPGKGTSQALLRRAFFAVSAGYKNLNTADTFCDGELSAAFVGLFSADTEWICHASAANKIANAARKRERYLFA